MNRKRTLNQSENSYCRGKHSHVASMWPHKHLYDFHLRTLISQAFTKLGFFACFFVFKKSIFISRGVKVLAGSIIHPSRCV